MRTKRIFSLAVLAVLLIPFNYAYINPTTSNAVNILCFLAVAFGTLLLLVINLAGSPDK